MVSGFGTVLADAAPSTVYVPAAVLPVTFTFWEPAPSSPASFTLAAEPDDMDSTCGKLRGGNGSAVIVFVSPNVPVEDLALLLTLHRHTTSWIDSPAANWAFRTGTSDTFTAND